jgi:hypothetical protein
VDPAKKEESDEKEKVLRLAKNLCDKKENGVDKVFEHQDMTPKRRQQKNGISTPDERAVGKGRAELNHC